MVQIKTDRFEAVNGRKPHQGEWRRWSFRSEDQMWEFTRSGHYEAAAAEAQRAYSREKDTRFGTLHVQP